MNDIKELRKLIKLCREQGVESIRFDGVELHLGALPIKPSSKNTVIQESLSPGGITDQTKIDMPDALTEEQLLMWSTGNNQ